MTDKQIVKKNYSGSDFMRFLLPSLFGVLILMIPFKNPLGEGTTIAVAFVSNLIADAFGEIIPYLVTIIIGIKALLNILYLTVKPDFITENEFIRDIAETDWFWGIVNILGFVFAIMTLFQLGPELVWSEDTGGLILFDLLLGLFGIFFLAGLFLPFLTDYGLLEFIGVGLTPIMRPLFTVPGRASIDAVASWVGDGTIGITLTNQQYLQGYYSRREAAVIATSFSAVSITFSLVILDQVSLSDMFPIYYGTVILVGVAAAIILPRIPPLSRINNEYHTGESMDRAEDIPAGFTTSQWGLHLAMEKVNAHGGLGETFKNGLRTSIGMWFGVMPIIMSFGTMATMLAEGTQVFQILGKPFLPIFNAFNIPFAEEASQTVMIGFADMFLPSVLIADVPSDMTRFIIATLSITQIIYMSETGALMLGTDIGFSLLDVFIIFIERTLISLPIIILVAKLIF